MSKLVLSELLDSVGINKTTLAKLMFVSPKTVQRMGDDVSEEVLQAINDYKDNMSYEQSEAVPVPVSPVTETVETPDINTSGYDVNLLNVVNHKNIALSCVAHGTGGIDKATIARSFNLSVFAYNAEVQNTVNHCTIEGTSFKELRS